MKRPRVHVSCRWRFPYHGREVTTSVPAGPGQAADDVEHLELELWRGKGKQMAKHGSGVVIHVSLMYCSSEIPEENSTVHRPRGGKETSHADGLT